MYFMNDSAAEMKNKLLGRKPEQRLHWLLAGVVFVLGTAILTMNIWAR